MSLFVAQPAATTGMRERGSVVFGALIIELALHSWLAVTFGSVVSAGLRYGLSALLVGRALGVTPPSGSIVRRAAVAFAVLAGVSSLWSTKSATTLAAALDLGILTMAALAAARLMSAQKVITTLATAMTMTMIFHLGGVYLHPENRVDMNGLRGWSGLLTNENDFGRQMVFAAVLQFSSVHRSKWYLWAGLVAVGSALMTGSAQVLVVLATTGLVLLGARLATKAPAYRNVVGTLLTGGIGIGAVWVSSLADAALAALGKDTTLTNRTPLWSSVGANLDGGNWVIGLGFNNVWNNPAFVNEVSRGAGFVPAQAHNSFVEAAAQLGVPGAILITLVLGGSFLTAWKACGLRAPGAWPVFALSVACITYSFSASVVGRAPVELYGIALIASAVPLSYSSRNYEIASAS